MLSIIYELCDDDKSTWGYGLFTGNGVEELNIEDVIELIENNQVDNASMSNGRIRFKNVESSLPKFKKSNYEPIDDDIHLYVVCTCKVNGQKGYLVISPLCKLDFVTKYELVNLCMEGNVCNVYLKPLIKNPSDLQPVQYNMPFTYIGEIEIE